MKNGFKVFVSVVAGFAYGLFFAQKSGKELRSELKKSDVPGKKFLEELKKMINESSDEISSVVKKSPEIQDLLKSGKVQFNEFVKIVRELGDETSKTTKEEIENLAKNAKNSVEKLKKNVEKKGTVIKKKIENKLEKEVKTIAKKLKK